jgi:sensor histidine kinase regulating citrate/malate metabolism
VREVGPWDLVETVREGLLMLDSDLTIRFANQSFRDTFAVPPEDAVGRKLSEVGDGQWDIPEFRVTLERARGELCLTVADNGQGIDPRRADSGLGGRLVEGVAQQLGGRLKRESGDKGTISCLTLPLREASYDRDREGLP